MEVALCPVCNTPLNEIDCFDETGDNTTLLRFCVGECPCCEKEYQYKEVFYFHHVEVNETPEED